MKPYVVAIISAPSVGSSFLTKQMACRHMVPGFFEGEDGIFTPDVLNVLNSEQDSPERYTWLTQRTKLMLERAHAIKEKVGITSYVDGDVLLLEAWLDAEIGTQSPSVLRKWIEENKPLMADKVLILTASEEKMHENMVRRGRLSEQNDFIRERACRVNKACIALAQKYAHVYVLDRSRLEFSETKVLDTIDQIIEGIPRKI